MRTLTGYTVIEEGTFTMGSPEFEACRDALTETQHEVTLTRPFWLKTTEVTQAQWSAVMGNNPSHVEGQLHCWGYNPEDFFGQGIYYSDDYLDVLDLDQPIPTP